MSTLLKQLQVSLEARTAERETLAKELDARSAEADRIVAEAEERGDGSLDPKETARLRELRDQIAEIDDQIAEATEAIDEMEERRQTVVSTEEIKDKARRARDEWVRPGDPTEPEPRTTHNIRVGAEPRTYSAESDRQGVSFMRDIWQASKGMNPAASERLERHQREARLHEAAGMERRDGTTANYAGLTVPQYLTDLVAPVARAASPTVQICNRQPLPADGMTVNISRITTGSTVAAQSDQGDAVSEQDIDDTLLTVNVRTYAGQQDISRQALERGTGVDSVIVEDLVASYWSTVDAALLQGAGTASTHTGIQNTSNIADVTYADASPTAAELYPKLAELISDIQSGVYMGVTHFIMHPRRWWWLASQIGTSFPLLQSPATAPQQAGNVGGTEYMAMNRNILGVPVVLDGNVTTTDGGGTEDVIYGVTAPELRLWHDDGPLLIRAEQPALGTLEVKFVVYSYSAFTAGRYPGAHGTINSTGLVAPTF